MRTLVTAVLVAREGGDWLSQTLAALAEQTRQPDRIIAVMGSSDERIAQQLAAGGVERIIATSGSLAFGEAVRQALVATPPEEAAGASSTETGSIVAEWLWLLTEDSAPEPRALARILRTVQRAPSVAVAGPKLVDWDRPERIIELGQSLTRTGERWLLRRQELDQQQYDHLQDVLGVGPVGMLVRRDVWQQLDGFDPALPVYDDGLDFSVRARLAGYRVVVAPESRMRFAQRGIAGPRIDRSRRVLRAAHRQGRIAHLHRRIAYAPAFFAFFMWLGLPLLAVARVGWALIREHPGRMWGEFASAMRVFFHPGAILASRRRIKSLNGPGWSAVTPLRVDPKTARTARMIDREAILAAQGRVPHELHFISSGGLAVLVAALVATAVLCWWAFASTSLNGGALAPLSPIGELWQHTRTQGGVPADPFTWVLAVLGSLTFWNPSHAIVLVLIAAIPLAALGGWVWAAQITESSAGRALVGLGWALSPVLLGSLAAGRLTTLILAIVLPWLLVAAARCRESWSWSGTASLLTAVALACAPILIPVAIVFLLVGIFSSVRGIARVLSIAIAPLALFTPKLIAIVTSGQPLNLLLDPGVTPSYEAANPRQLLLGFPEWGLEGWGRIFHDLGLGYAPASVMVGVLLLPLVLLAVLGIVTARVHLTLLLAALGGLGLLTAVAASQLRLVSQGAETVALWSGSGLALYWIAVLGLAAVGCTVLRRAAAPIAAVAVVLLLVMVSPLGFRLVTAQAPVASGAASLPAIVQAAGSANPELRTLVLTVQRSDAVRAELVEGSGLRLDTIRTEQRAMAADARDERIAELVGALASTGGQARLDEDLAREGIGFVLLDPSGDDLARSQLQSAFDQNTALSSAGQTDRGLLWRVDAVDAGTASSESDAARASDLDAPVTRLGDVSITARALWWIQVGVLLAMLLLALPTGEVVERPERRHRAKAGRAVAGPAGAAADSATPVAGAGPESDAEPVEASSARPAAQPVVSTQPVAEAASEPADASEPAGATAAAGAVAAAEAEAVEVETTEETPAVDGEVER